MCPDCDGLGIRYTSTPTCSSPTRPLELLRRGDPARRPAARAWAGGGRHIFEGVAQDARHRPRRRPGRTLPGASTGDAGCCTARGDRHIVYEWKQRGGKVWKHGGKWEGIVPQLLAQFKKTAGRARGACSSKSTCGSCRCPDCHGQRLNPQARAVRVGGKTLVELGAMPIGEPGRVVRRPERATLEQTLDPRPADHRRRAAEGDPRPARLPAQRRPALPDPRPRRPDALRRRGPAHPPRRADRLRAGRRAVHPRRAVASACTRATTTGCCAACERLRDMGNTVLVVEHDEDTMRAADYLVDFGPGPGVRGGEVVAAGTSGRGARQPGQPHRPVPHRGEADRRSRRSGGARNGKALRIVGARHNNLKNIDGRDPARACSSASPASAARARVSLVNDILLEALLRQRPARRGRATEENGDDEVEPTRRGRTTASTGSSTSTRSSTSTSRRSAARRARTRRRTSRCSTRSATCSPRCPRRRSAATSRAGSASTSPAAAARRARATARTGWRWTSSPTSG